MERTFLLTALVIVSIQICFCQTDGVKCLPSDRNALLDFKDGLDDPENALSSWRGLDCCAWKGITCGNLTGAVSAVDLHGLSGEIRPSLGQLKSLNHLDLSSNSFGGIAVPGFISSLKNLQYLNLSNSGFGGKIPPELGNLSTLQYLDLSNPGFPGLVSYDLQWITGLVSLKHLDMSYADLSSVDSDWVEMLNMLSHLTELHLSSCSLSGSIGDPDRVNLTSLAVVDLSYNGFNSVFPDWFVNISSLVYVDLSNCMLRGRIPLGLAELPNLRFLNLALNGNLSASSRSLFTGSWRSVEFLSLASNNIHGKLPASVGNMSSLTEFDLFDNHVEGGIPSTIGSLCKLVNFDLTGNMMNGSLPEFLEGTANCRSHESLPNLVKLRLSNNELTGRLPDWLGQLKSLKELSLAFNSFKGPIPASLSSVQSLTHLGLAGNRLNGTLPESIGQLSELVVLDASFNDLTGNVSEVHFSKLKKLKSLNLASNSLILNVDPDWIPPFQVGNLNIGSTRTGPSFPRWIRGQNEIRFLDLSNASLSGPVPGWFWDLSFNMSALNISLNRLQGQLPSSFQVTPFADVDFSSNMFEGSIPLPRVPVELFDMSNNRFNGSIPQNISVSMPDLIFLSLSDNQLTGQIPENIGNMSSLLVIDLSGNNLIGGIPSSIGKCTYLKVLDLGNNFLSGKIPNSIGLLRQLQSLHLDSNSISGEIPSPFRNLSNLETMDLGKNKLEGTIPPWLGQGFVNLRILNLGSNKFSGELLLIDLSNLTSLQVLDLSGNSLSGRIPASIGGLKSMQQEEITNKYLLYGKYRGVYYEESLTVNLKSQSQKYTKTLSLVTAIDLSGNNLSGDFPAKITDLHGLMILNLSRNILTGSISENISELQQLASLDLSSNRLSGRIPRSFDSLSSLAYLNLSHNDLSGEIPSGGQMSTFVADSFAGNSGLCGAPVEAKCDGEEEEKERGKGNDVRDDGLVDDWFYLSIGLGFAVGILVPCVVLVIRKPWSEKYFDFVENVIDRFWFVGRNPAAAARSTRERLGSA